MVIIGTGFGGQSAAVNLVKRGITDFLMLERRDFMGGTWCQNRYPRAAVDVQSPLYSLSFEPHPWSQMFAEQDELAEYTHHVIDKYGLTVPQDIQLVGFDDVTMARWQAYRLTTFAQDISAMVEQAFSLLLAPTSERPAQCLRLPARLVCRGTTRNHESG